MQNESATAEANQPGRRERKRMATREKLFHTALRLFAERGFPNTTIEDITEAADVGKGTFFNYFPTKEHVLRFFAEQQLARVDGWVQMAIKSTAPAKQVMRRLVTTATDLPGANPELMRAMLGAFLAQEEIRVFIRGQLVYGRAKVAEYLAKAQERGEIRQDISPEILARTFQQSMFGTMLFWSLNQDLPLHEYVDVEFEVTWAGMEAGPRREKAARSKKSQKEGQTYGENS